jgi:asparagine N-glycosylation enzyme membrane subunit Stt3
MEANEIIEKRKQALKDFFVKKSVWVIVLLFLILILGVYIRSLPMSERNGNPGLWNQATDSWTLGPDLDPYLFMRTAETILNEGGFQDNDSLRYYPLGFDNSKETKLLPYLIFYTYKLANIFSPGIDFYFAGSLFPLIMFGLTVLSFFFFVREVFIGDGKNNNQNLNANLIAIISTLIMSVIPVFLPRTIAGIPEKESAAFFFMFLSLYFFLKSWKSSNFRDNAIFGVLAGIATAFMGLIWGGFTYIFISIAFASFIAFLLNKFKENQIVAYSSWILISTLIMVGFSARYELIQFITSTTTGFGFLVLGFLIFDKVLWKTSLSKKLEKINLPKNLQTIIITILTLGILSMIFFGPSFIIGKINSLHEMMFHPVTGRWNITVAENKQPYFLEWASSFGPEIKGIPLLFWFFFVGSVFLFKKMLENIKKKDAWILTLCYIFLFFGLVFSRYSSESIFNGENFISKLFYYSSFLLIFGVLMYYYLEYNKERNPGFELINFEYLLLFCLFFICLFTARSAVRLIMVLGPIAPIFLGYLVIEVINKFKKEEDETLKIVLGFLMIVLILLSCWIFWNYYQVSKVQAYNFVPSYYNYQWQYAMNWVDQNTSKDAVFAHWWDYGYWVQSLGKRATVTDGGNFIAYWNYLMGRHVLTGDNEKDSLDFLYSHHADYLLIDPTDIGKYTAFSSIGSDIDYDRYSWIPTFVSDKNQIQETRDGIIRIYQGGSVLDEDIYYTLNGSEIFLPGKKAGIAGFVLEITQVDNSTSFSQPEAVFILDRGQVRLPVRYLSIGNEFYDFKTGINATLKIIESVEQSSKGISKDILGVGIFISPRVMRGYLAQKYLLNDPFNKFPNFELAHSEDNLIVKELNNYGLNLNEFVYFNGIQGPIKIWKINYTGKEEIKQEYLDTDPDKYLAWKL